MAVDPIRGGSDPQVRVAAAFTHELFEEHARMIYGLCRALLRDPDDADDATQSTFIAAYKSLLGGNQVREPAAWLATIARNECTARAQARMREPLPLLDADLGHSDGPESELERQALVADLQQAIATLPQKQREAVVLRDLYGLHYTEVGAALGISVASVESLLFRARRSLRVSLKPLAGGALAVPLAVREGIAQALPALTGVGASGGATSGIVGVGLLAKLAGGSAATKAAAGVAAAVAAGSIAVTGVEHRVARDRTPARGSQVAQIVAVASTQRDELVALPAPTGAAASSVSSHGRHEGHPAAGGDDSSAPSGGSRQEMAHTRSGTSSEVESAARTGHELETGKEPESRTGHSSASFSGGGQEQQVASDEGVAPPRSSGSGSGTGGHREQEPKELAETGGRSGVSGALRSRESTESDSSESGNSGPTTTSSPTDGGDGSDDESGHTGDGGHGGRSAMPPA